MALAGDLSEFPLTDIIQLIDLSKKSGAVHLARFRVAHDPAQRQHVAAWDVADEVVHVVVRR